MAKEFKLPPLSVVLVMEISLGTSSWLCSAKSTKACTTQGTALIQTMSKSKFALDLEEVAQADAEHDEDDEGDLLQDADLGQSQAAVCVSPKQCGCPPNFNLAWCNDNYVKPSGDWCALNSDNCLQCNGKWCTGSAATPSGTCKNWCSRGKAAWSKKCSWKNCKGCAECSDAGEGDCNGKCSSPNNCYVASWADPCMQSADEGACLAVTGAKWCGDGSPGGGGVTTPPMTSPISSPTSPPTPSPPPSPTSPIGGSSSEGCMTMWSTDNNVILGSHCGYAASSQGGMSASAAQSKYIQGMPRQYCAIHNNHFNGGEACGKCFKLMYDGNGFGTCSSTQANPAPNAGETVIQVVDSGSGNHDFDCVISTFEALTGHNTDRFPVSYQEVECETEACDQTSPGCIMTIASGAEKPQISNYYLGFARVTFHNLKTSVKSVVAEVGQCGKQTMKRNGAMFDVSFGVASCHKPVIFTATLSNHEVISIDATDWPAFNDMKYCHEPEVTWTRMTCDPNLR